MSINQSNKIRSTMRIIRFPNKVLRDRGGEIPRLHGSGSESPNSPDIGVPKTEAPIGHVMFHAEIPSKWCNLTQLPPWKSGEKVVLQLELQTSKEPIHPCRTGDVDRAFGLLLEPVICDGSTHIDIAGEVV